MSAQREPWLMIDPKPYVGDPTYDVLQHMLNCPGRLTHDPVGFSARIAQQFGLDPVRLGHWLFTRCIVDSPDRDRLLIARRLAEGIDGIDVD